MKANSIEELFGTLQQSIVAEWRKHLQTSKYSKHMALDEFYKEMPELVDTLIEDYNGHVGHKVEDFKNVLKAEDMDALKYLEELHELCQSGYDLLPEDAPELKSDLDAIKSKIDAVMYKVRELKESRFKSLTDFLSESLITESKKVNSPCTWDLVDLMDTKDPKTLITDYCEGSDITFHLDFIKLLKKLDSVVYTFDAGNLYSGDMYTELQELGAFDQQEGGYHLCAVLNKDGDNETSTIILCYKELTGIEYNKLQEFIDAYDRNPWMHIAQIVYEH